MVSREHVIPQSYSVLEPADLESGALWADGVPPLLISQLAGAGLGPGSRPRAEGARQEAGGHPAAASRVGESGDKLLALQRGGPKPECRVSSLIHDCGWWTGIWRVWPEGSWSEIRGAGGCGRVGGARSDAVEEAAEGGGHATWMSSEAAGSPRTPSAWSMTWPSTGTFLTHPSTRPTQAGSPRRS